MWDVITYPFPNFNGGTFEVLKLTLDSKRATRHCTDDSNLFTSYFFWLLMISNTFSLAGNII